MRMLNDMLSEQLGNDEFRKEYERIQPEMDVIRAIIYAPTSQNLTQKELSINSPLPKEVFNAILSRDR